MIAELPQNERIVRQSRHPILPQLVAFLLTDTESSRRPGGWRPLAVAAILIEKAIPVKSLTSLCTHMKSSVLVGDGCAGVPLERRHQRNRKCGKETTGIWRVRRRSSKNPQTNRLIPTRRGDQLTFRCKRDRTYSMRSRQPLQHLA